MRDRTDESISPPPDDGGHVGTYTKPQDLVAYQPEAPRMEDGRPQGPDTHWTAGSMHRHAPGGSRSGHALTVAVMVVVAVVVSALFLVF